MPSARFESDEVTLRRRNPFEIGLAVAIGVLGPAFAALLAFALQARALVMLAPVAIVVGALLRYRQNVNPIERLGRLSIGPLGLFFDGRRLASSVGLTCRGVSTNGDAPIVRIGAGRRTFEVRVVDAEEARRLVEALAPADLATQAVRLPSRVMSQPGQLARFGLYAVVLTAAFPLVGLAWHVDRAMALALLAMALGATAALVAGLIADTVVELGPIGVTVNWLGRKRLLAFSTIESFRMIEEASDWAGTRTQPYLAIAMKSGEVVRLPVGDAPSEAIRDFLGKARRALAQRPMTPTEAALRQRGGGVHAWFEAVRDLATAAGPATHRTAPVGPDALWRVVEDADATSDARAGAAIALVSALGEEAKTRLRIAALAAPPRLRVAFEAAAHATTEAELEQVLAEIAEPDAELKASEPLLPAAGALVPHKE